VPTCATGLPNSWRFAGKSAARRRPVSMPLVIATRLDIIGSNSAEGVRKLSEKGASPERRRDQEAWRGDARRRAERRAPSRACRRSPHASDGLSDFRGPRRAARLVARGSGLCRRAVCGRSGPRGNGRLREVWTRLDEIHAKQSLDAILVTGGMTDAGRSAEWAEFFEAFAPYPRLAGFLIGLPATTMLT
jgi:hypothetical protein